MRKETAEQIVHDIINDIMDRVGINGASVPFFVNRKQEIFDTWVEIIMSGSEVV